MKNYKKAAALVLGAVLSATAGGSSLQASDVTQAEEAESVIWQEEDLENMDLILEEDTEDTVLEEEIMEEESQDGSEEELIMEPEEDTESAESEAETETIPEASREGTCNEAGTVTWKLEEAGTLVIEGYGRMTDWKSAEEVPWDAYRSEIKAVDVKEGVENAGSYAFANMEALTDIQMADSVHEIGSYAFYESAGVDELVIG